MQLKLFPVKTHLAHKGADIHLPEVITDKGQCAFPTSL